jgi:hypothetical protein
MPTKSELQAQADALAKQAEEAQAAAAAAKEEADKPRTPEGVFNEMLAEILHHMGNPPRVQALYKEFMDLQGAKDKPVELSPESRVDAASGHTS